MTVLPQTVLLTGVLIEFRENERNRKSARKYQEREEGKKKQNWSLANVCSKSSVRTQWRTVLWMSRPDNEAMYHHL